MKKRQQKTRQEQREMQPECHSCSRFLILKEPCCKDACVFRNKKNGIVI